jgi:hypothetical protein
LAVTAANLAVALAAPPSHIRGLPSTAIVAATFLSTLVLVGLLEELG